MAIVFINSLVAILVWMIPLAHGEEATIIFGKDQASMNLVPGGDFTYGEDKRPINVPAFYIDQYEVTAQRYEQYLTLTDKPWPKFMSGVRVGNRPLIGVTWKEAAAYCEYYGKRLPSEQEWEKAARGTDGRLYPWGDAIPNELSANYAQARVRRRDMQTLPPINFYHDRLEPVGSSPTDLSP